MEGGRALIEVTYTIAENAPIASGVYRLKLEGDTSAITAPGQFLDLHLPGFFLRRPISICDWDERSVTLLYKVVGGGTDWLSRCTLGQALANTFMLLGLDLKDARTCVSISLIFISAALTAYGVYDNIAKYAGAGTLVPITGFANSMVSPALEFKS